MSSAADVRASTDNYTGKTEDFVTLTVNNELRAHLPRNEGVYEAGFLLEALRSRSCSNIPAELQNPSNKHKLVYFKTDYSEPSLIEPPATAGTCGSDGKYVSRDPNGASPSAAKPATDAKQQAIQNARALVTITNAAARAARAAAALAQQLGDSENHACLLKAVAAAEQMASEACTELAKVEPSPVPKSKAQELMHKLQLECKNYHLSHSLVDEERRKQLQEATEVNFDKRLKRIALYREWYKHLAEPTAPSSLQLHHKQQQQQQQQQPTQADTQQPMNPYQGCTTDCDYHSLARHALHSCMLELRKVKAAEERQKYVQPIASWSHTLRVIIWRGSAVQRLRIALQLAHMRAPPFSCVPGVTGKDCMAALVKNCPALFMAKGEALNDLVANNPELSDHAPLVSLAASTSKPKAQSNHAHQQAAKMLALSVYVRYLLGASEKYMQFFSSSSSSSSRNSSEVRGRIGGVGTSCIAGLGKLHKHAAGARLPPPPPPPPPQQPQQQQQQQEKGTLRPAVLAGSRSLLCRLRLLGSKPSKHEVWLHQQLCHTSEVEYQQQLRAYSSSPYPSLHEVLRDSVELGNISLPTVLGTAETLRGSSISAAGTHMHKWSAGFAGEEGEEEEEEEEVLGVARSTASAPGLLAGSAAASASHCKP